MTLPADPFEEIAAALDVFEDEAVSLVQQAVRDPLRGCPMRITSPGGGQDGEDLVEEIMPGAWRGAGYLDRRTRLPLNCPVVPLGSNGAAFFFLNTLGQVHVLKDSASGKGPIDALFQGRPQYLEWAWPRLAAPKHKSDPWTVKGYEADECRRDLFAACAYKGTFELEDRVRGRGAWPHDDGSLIYHAGDGVWIDGRWRPCGEIGRHIYPARPKLGRPSAKYEHEGQGSPGDYFLELLSTFNWERPALDPKLALGWWMTAVVGGALEQRPVAMITGQEGAGKSTLQKMLRFAMNGALVATSNTTQAGIYQRVQQDSIAVLVDENEAKEDTRTTDKLMELARVAYSGDKMLRGGQDHQGKEFAVMSSFLFSSIAEPSMTPQDASRMVKLMMRPLESAAVDGVVEAKKLELIGRQLMRRWFTWWPRWAGLQRAFRLALIEAGHKSRSADTFVPLAAACHVALRDDMPAAAELEHWAATLAPATLEETANQEPTWRRCLTHLLQAQPDAYRQITTRSVGDVLRAYRDNTHDAELSAEKLDARMAQVGLATSWQADEAQTYENMRLFVPSNHPAVWGLFEGTPWQGRRGVPGPWAGVLRQAPKPLWRPAKCSKGLDKKTAGIFIDVARALEA